MNKQLSVLLACIFLMFLYVQLVDGAIITTHDGETLEVESIVYKGDILTGQHVDGSDNKTIELKRENIKNISFTAKKQEKVIDKTEMSDLAPYMEKARQMLEQYSDARFLVVAEEASYVHRTNGTNVKRFRNIVYIAKEEALWNAQKSYSFDPDREKIRIIHARSMDENGQVENLDEKEITIDKGTSGSVYFSKNMVMSFTIPKVSVGSLIDYSYEIEEYNPFDKNLFQGRCYFKWAAPVGSSILRVSVPSEKELHYVAKNAPDSFKPEIIEAIDNRIYTWKMENLEPVIPEPRMPPYREIVPSVYFSLHKTYDYMNSILKPMYEKRFQLTDLVKEKVDEITKGAKNTMEKIARLYLFCQKEIRYISIKSNLASNQVGHVAEETLKNKYGDCTDKGMLLATMLKHIGVEAYPVVIRTNDSGQAVREVAIFDDNHCITEIHLDGRIFYLDSTATDYKYPYFRSDDHDTVAKNAMLGTLRNVPLPPPEDNTVSSRKKMKLYDDGTLDVENYQSMNGSTEASMRRLIRSVKPEEYEKAIRANISALTADYELQKVETADPLDFSKRFNAQTKYSLNRYAPKSGKYMIFTIPYFEMSFGEVSLEKRNYDIQYLSSSLRTEHITIDLPKNYQVKYLPPAIRIQSPYIEFEVIYDQQGDKIEVTSKLAILKRIVPVKDYQEYKQDLEKIAFSGKQKIFLEKIEGSESDIEADTEGDVK